MLPVVSSKLNLSFEKSQDEKDKWWTKCFCSETLLFTSLKRTKTGFDEILWQNKLVNKRHRQMKSYFGQLSSRIVIVCYVSREESPIVTAHEYILFTSHATLNKRIITCNKVSWQRSPREWTQNGGENRCKWEMNGVIKEPHYHNPLPLKLFHFHNTDIVYVENEQWLRMSWVHFKKICRTHKIRKLANYTVTKLAQ